MSIYTNAVYGIRKYADGSGPNYELARRMRLENEQKYKSKVAELAAEVKNGKMSLAAAQKALLGTKEDLAKERSAHSGTQEKLNEALNTVTEYGQAFDDLNSKQDDLQYLGKQGLKVLKNRALGAWENAKHDAVDIYTRGIPALKERYAANKDLYDNLGFIGGGAIGGGALGALLAGRGNRLIGGTLGAIGGGSAGYLAKVLAKKYGYMA